MRAPPPFSGLCESCMRARRITSGRGSQFVLCELSRTDPRYPRYPRLPVLRCGGYEPLAERDLDAPEPEP